MNARFLAHTNALCWMDMYSMNWAHLTSLTSKTAHEEAQASVAR